MYKDRQKYIHHFNNLCLDIDIITKKYHIITKHSELHINNDICTIMMTKIYSRSAISKYQLHMQNLK